MVRVFTIQWDERLLALVWMVDVSSRIMYCYASIWTVNFTSPKKEKNARVS